MGQHKYKAAITQTNPESDQWRSGGDCSKCRRHSYCKGYCKQKEKRIRALVLQRLKAKGLLPPGAKDLDLPTF